MTRDRSFYRQFFTLCLTLMAERLVVCSVNLLDNIMLGSYAETAMAAAAAVNQLQFLFQQLIYATGAGMVIHGMRRKMSEHTGTTTATPADTAMNSGSPSGDTMP